MIGNMAWCLTWSSSSWCTCTDTSGQITGAAALEVYTQQKDSCAQALEIHTISNSVLHMRFGLLFALLALI